MVDNSKSSSLCLSKAMMSFLPTCFKCVVSITPNLVGNLPRVIPKFKLFLAFLPRSANDNGTRANSLGDVSIPQNCSSVCR